MNIKETRKKLQIRETSPKDKTVEDLASEIGTMVTELRILQGITQDELAEKIGTKQPSIARLENGSYLPNLKTLYKIAKAMDTYLLVPKFNSLEKGTITTTIIENPSTSFCKADLGYINNNQVYRVHSISNTINTIFNFF